MVEPYTEEPMKSDGNGRHWGKVVIVNPQGLHMRPAMAFARLAQSFSSSVTVWMGDRSVNGKSLIDLMLLAAEPGSELKVEVDGSDAHSALPVLMEILAAPSAEELE
jgi:phosphocarrier protein HPr